jgi:hypothetical protein
LCRWIVGFIRDRAFFVERNDMLLSLKRILNEPREPTKSIKVSITLPAYEWNFVDESITNGFAQSRSEYFRKLHMAKNN